MSAGFAHLLTQAAPWLREYGYAALAVSVRMYLYELEKEISKALRALGAKHVTVEWDATGWTIPERKIHLADRSSPGAVCRSISLLEARSERSRELEVATGAVPDAFPFLTGETALRAIHGGEYHHLEPITQPSFVLTRVVPENGTGSDRGFLESSVLI